MSTHISRTYLNSCLKAPIAPCRKCPVPDFGSPKMYLGRLSATPNTPNTIVLPKHCRTTETEHRWYCSGIKSLAQLLNSIPDYTDLTHLNQEEFHSTLNTLRSTCQELKIKPIWLGCEDSCSITTGSSSSIKQLEGSKSKKSKKSKKTKRTSESRYHKKFHKTQPSPFKPDFIETEKKESFNKISYKEEHVQRNSLSKSLKKNVDEEAESFKKSLQEFEAEFRRPFTSLNLNESRSFTRCSSKEILNTSQDDETKLNEKLPTRRNLSAALRERLRKSLSCNDLQSLKEPQELLELRKKNKTLELLSFKGERRKLKDGTKLSNYFCENSNPKTAQIPNIVIDSTNTDKSSTSYAPEKIKSQQKRIKSEEYKMPFKLFELDTRKKEGSIKYSTPSPIHPVARPNLAATLRAESSKRKLQELKTNCIFQDTTTQFDWEVRKTPAWKTLSLNETHKQILQLRLATRKAEQALQQREYELNMELMRQRVKSGPLLLEGPTHWGPHVGKLSHICLKEARRHMCPSNQQRARCRKHPSHSNRCRHEMLFSTTPLEEENAYNSSNALILKGPKLNTLREIYGRNSNGAKPQSRNSNHNTNTQQSLKYLKKKNLNNAPDNEIDSADELSSMDRAFL